MEINSKQFLIVAAVGAAAWYMLRKSSGGVIAAAKPAPAPAGGAASIWDGFGVSDFSGMAQAIMGAGNSAAQQVAAQAPAPAPAAPAPAPAQEQRAVFGGTSPGGSSTTTRGYLDADGVWHYPDGSTAYTGGGTFGHVSQEQRAGRTDGQLAMAILGY